MQKVLSFISFRSPRISGNLKESKKWADQVIKLKQNEFPDVDRLIVSDEFL